ncbi:putative entry exclusion protein TrbK-alt [Acidiphilium sp. PA]|uniref:putative entry exclusion protein TrbK-alt n=1 Tax=Acidiphilium sp. PA TaxID=2871705 RepID=UPI0022434DAC|nr:putative entry exclusion protein TrbK-alt [Acidiphilium sp. PA]MCW8309206.1 putative entry exclusion protein TrbK-alt [Acidiphilium sp. PA]
MNAKFLVAISFIVIEIVGTSAPARASAPTIDQLVANPKMLTAELDRCKQLGMAANNDARCHTAWQAENKQFFGKAPTYTQKPVNLFPNTPNKLVPAEHEQTTNPSNAGTPHG